MPNPVFRFATVSGQNIHWFLKRNCSITPAQLGWLYASQCVVTLGIGTFFWFQGAKLVLPFAWLELMAVGSAFLVYSRHATDGERISNQHRSLNLSRSNRIGYQSIFRPITAPDDVASPGCCQQTTMRFPELRIGEKTTSNAAG